MGWGFLKEKAPKREGENGFWPFGLIWATMLAIVAQIQMMDQSCLIPVQINAFVRSLEKTFLKYRRIWSNRIGFEAIVLIFNIFFALVIFLLMLLTLLGDNMIKFWNSNCLKLI
jgi:hypothetical protein